MFGNQPGAPVLPPPMGDEMRLERRNKGEKEVC